MGLEMEYGWALLLLPVCLWAIWFIDRRYGLRSRTLKRRVTLAVRMVLATLLALAIAGPSVWLPTGGVTRWVLFDVSDSTDSVRSEASEMITQALAALPQGQQAGVIAFGADAMVETPMSEKPAFDGQRTRINGEKSNLESALRLAVALAPSCGITVVTDGKASVSQSAADALTEAGVSVDALILADEAGPDAQVTEWNVPAEAYEGQTLSLRAVIDANTAMDATLAVYQNGVCSETREISLQKGENRFAFTDTAVQSGVVTYEARLVSAEDTQPRNNSAASYVRVLGAPSIALITQNDGISALFTATGMKVETLPPTAMPGTAEGYLAYDAVVLHNIDFASASDKQWQALDAAVRTLGRGLCVLGGDSSYALGGYRGTLLEELLPVRIDVRQKLRMPTLSLVICIDKSGSMTAGQFGSTRVEVAKEAAMSAVEALTEKDNIGVIGFDDTAKWVVPFQNASDPAGIQEQIGTLRADGGTAFYSALDEAFLALSGADTPQKHVIFLSDGQPADDGFQAIAQAMGEAGITLTTVAVGDGADQPLMRQLAQLGKGRFYAVGEFDNIPRLFLKETVLAGGSYVQNRTFAPVVTESGTLTDFEGFPFLDGYLTTTEKEAVHVAMISDTEEPLLAWWNAGAGKVVAWTSDAEGAWTQQYLAWEETPRFFGGMVGQTLPGDRLGGTLEAVVDGDTLEIIYTSEEQHALDTRAAVILPDGAETAIKLVEEAPGRYTGRTEAARQGAYAIRVTQNDEKGVVRSREGGAVKRFSREYDLRAETDDSLSRLCERTGGRLLSNADAFWDTPVRPAAAQKRLREALCLAALFMLLIDIALRKLPWEEVFLRTKERETLKPSQEKPTAPPKPPKPDSRQEAAYTANALLEAKRARKQS